MDERDSWTKRRAEQRLAEELNRATAAFGAASARVNEVAADALTFSLPYPDSMVQIQNVRTENEVAFAKWRKAMDRWLAFVKEGVIPEDLGI